MPKMKTHSGAKKRFKVTGSGKIRRRGAFLNHLLEKKGESQKRRLARGGELTGGDLRRAKKVLGKFGN